MNQTERSIRPQARPNKKARVRQRRMTAMIAILAITLLLGTLVGLGISQLANTLKMGTKVNDQEVIAWCEQADPTSYQEVKEELANLIESKTGFTPDSIVFQVGGGNYQTKLYTVSVYYEVGNCWFEKEFRFSSIIKFSPELDKMLCDIYTA